jgi:hypothetical protein
MTKSDSQSLQRTLAFAATVAALGASVGVPVDQALAAPPESSAAKAGPGAVQQKADRRQEMGAPQTKWKANQGKEKRAKAIGGSGGAGGNVMLNPQPLPPKQGFGDGSVGQKSPTMQK